MNHSSISALPARQRRFLSELTRGAQGVYRYGRFEAHIEEAGKVRACAIELTPEEVAELRRAVPDLVFTNVAEGRPAFVRLPAQARPGYSDALTATMPTQHLYCGPEENPDLDSDAAERPMRERTLA